MWALIQDGRLRATFADRDEAIRLARRLEGAAGYVLPLTVWGTISFVEPHSPRSRQILVHNYPGSFRCDPGATKNPTSSAWLEVGPGSP